MEAFLGAIKFAMAHYQEFLLALIALIVAIIALLKAAIAIALLIPGDQPEGVLYKISALFEKAADFLSKFSKK